MRLDGYVRVSRVGGREGEGYISPAVQREAVEAYAAELGGRIVHWHTDEDFSGGNIARPGFQAALERLREGGTDGIVVMRIDRFARSVADGAAIVREIIERDQVFASCHERIDPRTPEGRYMLNAFLANAELFLDQAKAAWKVAKARAIARGVHIGPTPIGYERRKSQPLRPHPVEGPAVAALFRRAATGRHGDTDLARWMQERVPRGVPYRPSEIRRWLSNRLYLGEIHHGELANTEAHEPLTDAETFERCQRAPGIQRRAMSPFLLSGLIRCANCRYAMGGQSRGGADGQTRVYRCHRSCGEASVIVAGRVEEYLLGLVRSYLRGLRLTGEAGDRGFAQADREAQEAEAELRSYASDLDARRILGDEMWREGLRLRSENHDVKRARRARIASERELSDLSVELDDLDHHDLRDLLAGLVSHVFVRRRRGAPACERVLVVWSTDDPVDVPGPHRPGPFEPVRW